MNYSRKRIWRIRSSSSSRRKAWSQRVPARRLGVARLDLSNLYRGWLHGFSMERLCRLLTALGEGVRIVVQPNLG